MKKLALRLETLEVETFDTDAVTAVNEGSVVAFASGDPLYCETYDPRNYLCYFSAELGGRNCTPVCYTADPADCG